MKTLTTLIFTFLFSTLGIAQNGINYKAIIKNNTGNVVANSIVVVEFSILSGAAQTVVYKETHSPATDANGLIILNIGEGTPVTGTFVAIDWASDTMFLNTKINTGAGLVDMGTTEFKTVPYAKNAETASNVTGLEAIDEGNGIGWRLKGRNPNYYGNIGFNAVDISTDYNSSSIRTGATGNYSTAMGVGTTASGYYSVAMGVRTKASGDYSVAMGDETTASGENSIAMGQSSKAIGESSKALGPFSEALGYGSTAIGNYSKASADYATAMGNSTEASGNNSTAMGAFTKASGESATAMGFSTQASGESATAMGKYSMASGNFATAMGYDIEASGESATAMGRNTAASSYASLAIGRYNVAGGNATSWVATDRIFEIGYGTYNQRSNAFTVLKNGKVGIGTPNPSTFLHITNGYNAKLNSGTGYFVIGYETGTNMVFDNNDIMVRNNGAPATLFLQNDGGAVRVGGVIVHSSDGRLKKDVTPLSYGLETILELNPVEYNWKNREQDFKSLGLIAQEVQPVIENIVRTADDEDNTLSVSYTELIPVLIKAIQEQQELIKSLQTTVRTQDSQIGDLKAESNLKDEVLNTFDQRLNQFELLLKKGEL